MLSEPQPFHLATVPLQRGTALIEASAGTGKTFSIAGVFLRLVLEEGVPIRQILAVTYTVAATQELRERVRRRLHEALTALRAGNPQNDEILSRFLASTPAEKGIQRLNAALQSFDEAQIFTIHGFCQRVLRDHAFESGQRFDAELATDAEPLLRELVYDFWRQRFYAASPLLAALSMAWKESPDCLLKLLNRTRNHPNLVLIPAPEERRAEEIAQELAEKFEAIRAAWKKHRPEIEALLSDPKILSQDAKRGLPPPRLAEILERIDEVCEDFDKAPPACVAALTEICSSNLKRLTKANKETPVHEVFELCEEFCPKVKTLFRQLRYEFLEFARQELPRRKLHTNTVTYDDLLTQVHAALSKDGEALAGSVRGQYQAALIDEFQDTDPLQYGIFHRIFAGKDSSHWLYFIGDPKQAIYGFRGADVFTYLSAAETASRFYTLETNWRSEERLLVAMNALFQTRKTGNPFVINDIAYREVHAPAASRKDFAVLTENSAKPPLQIRLLATNRPGGKPLTKDDATDAICDAVAADIIRLRRSKARLGGRDLRFRDIAVLVRTHRQAAAIQEALMRRGIHGVLHTDCSVFATVDAIELQRLLEGILEPQRDASLKAALATRLIGLCAAEVAALDRDEACRQKWIDRFAGWKQLWEQECFIAMLRKVLVDMKVRENLVKHPGGERRLTDLLHLGELLHEAASGRQLSPGALLRWLRDQRTNGRSAQESHQLRLESDDDAVMIATVHKSKGLEYPIVFCPFLWSSTESKCDDTVQFHDRDHGSQLTYDLRGKNGAAPQHAAWHEEEARAEEMRLLYVAVTRAKNRCVLYAAETKDFIESPLAQLAGAGAFGDLGNLAEGWPPAAAEQLEISAISTQEDAAETLLHEPQTEPGDSLRAQTFSGKIARTALGTNFTALTQSASHDGAARGADEPDQSAGTTDLSESNTAAHGIFAFPRGPRAGDFFHDLLEHLDFTNPASLETMLPAKLTAHGFDAALYARSVQAAVQNVLDADLDGFALRSVPRARRLSEVKFTHPLSRLAPEKLVRVYAGCDQPLCGTIERLGQLKFDPVEGFMTGVIDLLFEADGRYYIVDWKSNHLGDSPGDYDLPGLEAAMLQHHYYLQSHLYVLAADLFLKQRLPGYDYDRHFGGVFYIFLRGVDSTCPQRGIYRTRPAAEFVAALRTLVSDSRP